MKPKFTKVGGLRRATRRPGPQRSYPDRVVFRKYWHDYDDRWTPIAFLPDVEVSRPGWVMSYEHCGQHGEACMNYYRDTKPCEPELYAPLLKELEGIGYRLRIMKRITRRKP